eukprot:CAMPEP_0201491476 /NCGR_PEP_ID=MMETSP0151_2-20130828/29982_1 /ASSEMBLY_ACC=CAM_ASM_000257 /TAXON_ID=200890 /ORGANISM="Paramoeba atlantica, Strain 621/1 / CCAP 1560/9" /LENGTH=240 /DNA_ID=CAMNT_0047877845 /DNA_START=14 /DNA_END=736 /DNA_ORIENTATION=+
MGGILSRSYGKSMREVYEDKRVEVAVLGSYESGKEEMLISHQLKSIQRSLQDRETSKLSQVTSGSYYGQQEFADEKMLAQVYEVGGRSGFGHGFQKIFDAADALILFHSEYESSSLYYLKEAIRAPTFKNKPIMVISDDQTSQDRYQEKIQDIRNTLGITTDFELLRIFLRTEKLPKNKFYDEAFDWFTMTIASTYASKWAELEEMEEKQKEEEEQKKMKKKLFSKYQKKSPVVPAVSAA